MVHVNKLDLKLFHAVSDGQNVWNLLDEGHVPATNAEHKAFIRRFIFLIVTKMSHDRLGGTFSNGLVVLWPLNEKTVV